MSGRDEYSDKLDALTKQIHAIERRAMDKIKPLQEQYRALQAQRFAAYVDSKYGLTFGEKRLASNELMNNLIERRWTESDIKDYKTFTVGDTTQGTDNIEIKGRWGVTCMDINIVARCAKENTRNQSDVT